MMVAILMTTGCAATDGPGGSIPFRSIAGGHGPDNGISGQLKLPPGTGPFPVVIVLHGCGGIARRQQDWAQRLNQWGYATLILDSFGPRGIRSVCAPADQPKVRPHDRASDVVSAALWLQTQPGLDPNRIGVLGESHGGTTAAWVTQEMFQSAYPGLIKAAVDYYGGCSNAGTYGGVPLLALAGEADDWGHPAVTCKDFAKRVSNDQPVEVHTYPGVYHAFDNPDDTALRLNEGHPMLYNQAAAEDSYQRVQAFFARYLRAAADAAVTPAR
jgi:dienelactone hydrolase